MNSVNEIEQVASCPVCGGRSFTKLSRPRYVIGEEYFHDVLPEIGLVRCGGCGLEFVNPRPSLQVLQGFYEQPGYVHHEADHGVAFHQNRLDMIQTYTDGRRLLDVGCGGGSFLAVARDSGYVVTGMEPSSSGLANTARQGIEVHESLLPLCNAGRRFDVVTLWHVLEHIPDPVRILGQIRTLLDEDGVLLVAVPNIHSARAWLLRMFPALSHEDSRYRAFPIHLQAFCGRSLALLMKRTGFQCRAMTTRYIAVDELLLGGRLGKSCPDLAGQVSSTVKSSRRPPSMRMGKGFAKKVFFGLKLGESLIAISGKV